MIMCVAAYEMKRLGLVQKPLIIGLKANVHEIADTFRKAYPTAKVLYPGKEDFTPANRKEVFSKIKNNNWDCIILTHDQFSKDSAIRRNHVRHILGRTGRCGAQPRSAGAIHYALPERQDAERTGNPETEP